MVFTTVLRFSAKVSTRIYLDGAGTSVELAEVMTAAAEKAQVIVDQEW